MQSILPQEGITGPLYSSTLNSSVDLITLCGSALASVSASEM